MYNIIRINAEYIAKYGYDTLGCHRLQILCNY